MNIRFLLAFALLLFAAPIVRADDLDAIKARGELRHLGIKYANFVTGAGDGLDVELVQGFARHIGVKYTLVYSDFYSIIRDLLGKDVAVKDGKAILSGQHPVKGDMIATGFTVLPWRKQVLLYSDPVFPTQVLLVARAEAPQRPLAGSQSLAQDIRDTKAMIGKKSLLVMEKTCLDPAGYGLKGTGIDLRPYTKNTNINEMVPAMLNGVAEYTLLDVADVILDLQKWAGRIKVLGPISEEQEMAAAFPPDAPQLRDAFNAYLRQVRADGTYDRLVRKYYPGIHSYFPAFFASAR
jgi:ABC-type amino acid transport substrate-binding protein